MIVTVSLNTSLDKTYSVSGFAVGGDALATRVEYSPGGKALNVASFAQTLGARVLATGIVAGHAGRHVRQLLTQRRIEHDFVETVGETRSCHIIHDPEGNTLTQIREAGPVVPKEVRRQLVEKVEALTAEARLFVFSGSVPGGLGADVYQELIELVRGKGVPAILDAAGELLELGLLARPNLIKPNLDELRELAARCGLAGATSIPDVPGADVARSADASPVSSISFAYGTEDHEAFRRLVAVVARAVQQRFGVDVAASLGPLGAVVVEGDIVYAVVPPDVTAVNTVSCGDALVAGIATGWTRRLPTSEAVRLGVATATAKALLFETGKVNPQDVEKLLPQVEIAPIQLPN